jgi:hypothetical protein
VGGAVSWRIPAPPNPPPEFAMSTKYWDIYVLYIERCVKDNYENDIDPAHYEMEWNHFWPKSIFGDWPIGQYLTLRQHAIASALQTLVFKENCMCGWHKSYLPSNLLELAWPYFCEACSISGAKGAIKTHSEKDELGRSVNAVKVASIMNAEKDEFGRSVNAVKGSKKALVIQHSKKDENGKSLQAVKAGRAAAQSKTLEEMQTHGLAMAQKLHAEKDENGLSVFGLEKCGEARKRISVIYPDNSIKIFRSISEAGRFFRVGRHRIKNVMSGKPSSRGRLAGLRFERVE